MGVLRIIPPDLPQRSPALREDRLRRGLRQAVNSTYDSTGVQRCGPAHSTMTTALTTSVAATTCADAGRAEAEQESVVGQDSRRRRQGAVSRSGHARFLKNDFVLDVAAAIASRAEGRPARAARASCGPPGPIAGQTLSKVRQAARRRRRRGSPDRRQPASACPARARDLLVHRLGEAAAQHLVAHGGRVRVIPEQIPASSSRPHTRTADRTLPCTQASSMLVKPYSAGFITIALKSAKASNGVNCMPGSPARVASWPAN